MEDKKRHVIKIHIRARRNYSCRDPALQDPARWSCEGLQGGKPGWAPHTQVSEIPYTVFVWLCWYGAGIPHTPGCGVWKLICISGPLPVFFSTDQSWSLYCPPRAQKHCMSPSCHSSWMQDVPVNSRGTLRQSLRCDPLTLPPTPKEAQEQLLLLCACACTFQMPWLRICLPSPLLRPPTPAMFFSIALLSTRTQ